MVARVVKVVDCRCHGRSSFSALQLIDLSRQTVSLKVDTEGQAGEVKEKVDEAIDKVKSVVHPKK
jgi:hypothetical protein